MAAAFLEVDFFDADFFDVDFLFAAVFAVVVDFAALLVGRAAGLDVVAEGCDAADGALR